MENRDMASTLIWGRRAAPVKRGIVGDCIAGISLAQCGNRSAAEIDRIQ
jgi:hypothetical protein